MMNSADATTAVAHIITAAAANLGDPEIIITTHAWEGKGEAREIERWSLDNADDPSDWHEIAGSLTEHGWRAVTDPRIVERGYSIATVERV